MDANARRHIDAAVTRLLNDLAGGVVADARRLVPVDTGGLKATIQADPATARSVRITAGNESVDYAAYVELGTRRMAAQPYLRPSLYRRRGA